MNNVIFPEIWIHNLLILKKFKIRKPIILAIIQQAPRGIYRCPHFPFGFKKMKGLSNRESVIDALDGLNSFNIGLGQPLHLSAKRHQASHRVLPTVLKKGKFVTFEWKDFSRIMKTEK